jgi:hypothetical protein
MTDPADPPKTNRPAGPRAPSTRKARARATTPEGAPTPRPESPIFLKSYETLVWLLQHTRKFPKDQRFVLGQRLEQAALDLHDALIATTRTRNPRSQLARLGEADLHLERLRVYNRLAHDLKLHAFAAYEHLARLLDELGRLLGGWLKSLYEPAQGASAR